ncbi:MAG: hydroxyacid dehydrogenase [Acidimicrobiales bacterium]|nr:MAG: hydroxyacid dehydrogenase [Acidimicrobiales bacterium]
MLRVFVTHNPEDLDAYYGRSLPPLQDIAEVRVNPLDRDLTTPELIDAAKECQVIVAHRATPGDAELFAQSPDLVAFLRTAVDISTVDVDAASGNGVLVAHADKSFVASTAELALALMLDLSRNVSASTIDYGSGQQPPQRGGVQMSGRTAGIIGLGAIGSYLAELLQGIGMTVVAHDPHVTEADVEMVSFAELLGRSDYVLPLAVSIPETHGLIGEAELSAMKPGAFLVNVSRGELLDEAAVAAALDSGHLGGLGMDVGQAPDQRPSPELAARPGVVATPHLGGLTPENADAQAASSVEQVQAMLEQRMPPRTVNEYAATRLRALWTGAVDG